MRLGLERMIELALVMPLWIRICLGAGIGALVYSWIADALSRAGERIRERRAMRRDLRNYLEDRKKGL